jgi:uncharacterized protein
MALALDVLTLGAPDVLDARSFYTTVLSTPTGNTETERVDLHGTGQVALAATEALAAVAGARPATSGFRGFVLTYNLSQPSEVELVMDAADAAGAEVLKPAKKALFGSFSGSFRAPDGAIWKVAAATKKNTGPAGKPPIPTESTVILGVPAPKESKRFYQDLGMTVDRDYGNKYIDFHPATGAVRFCLMERRTLAKDVGTTHDGNGFHAVVFDHEVDSREGVDTLLANATTAGGEIIHAPEEAPTGGAYTGCFTDPDGFHWRIRQRAQQHQ